MTCDPRWWDSAFGAAYLDVYAHRDDATAASEVRSVSSLVGGVAGRRVLDAGCGAGRHARALAEQGAHVVGLDRSCALLVAAAARGGAARYVRGDLRAFPLRSAAFDRVLSFFTSFGYFDAAGDRAQLGEVRRVLRPAGRFVIDFLNAPRLAAELVASSERVVAGRTVREERAIRRGRIEKFVEVVDAGSVVATWRESVRLYGRDELGAMLRAAGFRVVAEHGDVTGAPWCPSSPRLVVVADVA